MSRHLDTSHPHRCSLCGGNFAARSELVRHEVRCLRDRDNSGSAAPKVKDVVKEAPARSREEELALRKKTTTATAAKENK